MAAMARPPIQHWMPNHPQATMARRMRGNVGADGAERGSDEDREGDAVLGAGVGVQQHGDEDDEVAEQHGGDGLEGGHAAGDEARGEHVGGDLHGHGEPERDVVVGGPGACGGCGGGEVGVVEARVVVWDREQLGEGLGWRRLLAEVTP